MNNQDFTQETYASLVEQLKNMADEKYRAFNQKLVPIGRPMLGIQLPKLRSLAKEIAKGDWHEYLCIAQNQSNYYEEVMLQGLVIGAAKADIAEILPLTAAFVPKIDNWAVCDSFCAGLKIVAKNKEEVFIFLQEYLQSDQEFFLRFAVVLLMDFYISEEYIDRLLLIFDGIHQDEYYVKMAVAWALSVCFVKFEQKTMAYLNANSLDDFTYNKALQKIVESYRVTDEIKTRIRSMKRNRNQQKA